MKGQYTKEQLCSISKAMQSVLIEQFDVPSKEYFQIYQKHEDFEFYQKLSCLLSSTCRIRQEDVFIMLVESERENWSFGNGLAQAFEPNNGGVQ
jgi:hypothetical protein